MLGPPDSTSSAALQEMVAELKSEAAPFFERWDAVDRQEFYHYTSLGAATEILRSRTIWASDVLSMNDTSEFKFNAESTFMRSDRP